MANSSLTFSAEGINEIKADEGVVDGLYDDPVGYCTSGVGHLAHSKGKWSCFLLAAASADADFKPLVLKKWPGKKHETPYLTRAAAFKGGFDALKTKAATAAQDTIAQKKYKKAYAALSATQKESVDVIAKSAVDEQARLLTKTPDEVLREDLKPFEKTVRKAVKIELRQAEFDALVSITFNIGATNFLNSTLLKEINKNKFRTGDARSRKAAIAAIESAFGMWKKSGGKVLDGLVKRRKKEATRFLKEARDELKALEDAQSHAPKQILGSASRKGVLAARSR